MKFKKKSYCFLFIYICIYALGHAQNIDPFATGKYEDIFNFQNNTLSGSARYQGLGGAFNSLGGDMASININPAGLGFYQKSEFSFGLNTQLLSTKNNTSNLSSTSNLDATKQQINLNHFGIVFESKLEDEGDFYGGAWGISYQRVKNFHQSFSYTGTNNQNSIRDSYLEELDIGGIPTADLFDKTGNVTNQTQLAWDTFVLFQEDASTDSSGNSTNYTTFNLGDPVNQTTFIEREGGISEWSIAYGGNINDQVYFGLSSSLVSVNYNEKTNYSENLISTSDSLRSFIIDNEYNIEGTGVNFKAGIIYSPIHPIKLSFSVTTPSWIWLTESENTSLSASYNSSTTSLNQESAETTSGSFNYRVKTPLTLRLGSAFFFQKYGFVSVDVEYIDYSNANLKSPTFDFSADNRTIQSIYKPVWNFKIGAEGRYENLRFRLGFSYFGDPFKESSKLVNINRSRKYITAGFGYKTKNKSFDLSITRSSHYSTYSPYSLENENTPFVKTKNVDVNILLGASFYY